MKIAILSEYKKIGGGETNAIELACSLRDRYEQDVTIIGSGEFLNRANERGLKTKNINLSQRSWIKFIPILRFSDRKIRKDLEDYDIIHAYSLNVLPKLMSLKNKKIYWTNHGYWERAEKIRLKIILIIVKKIIAVNEDIYKGLETTDARKKQINLGVGYENNEMPVYRALNKNCIISCIGRFQRIKGQDCLIEALSIVAEKLNAINFTVNFVGDVTEGDEAAQNFKKNVIYMAEKAVNNNENLKIYFNNYTKNVNDWYGISDFIVVPSLYESFSMVCVEALAMGKPVIAPDIGGPKFIINSDKVGEVFRPGDAQDLAEKIIILINRYSKLNPFDCKERAEYFHIDKQAKHVLDLYLSE